MLLVADFGPRITVKIVESLRDDIYAGRLKSGPEIKVIFHELYLYIVSLIVILDSSEVFDLNASRLHVK